MTGSLGGGGEERVVPQASAPTAVEVRQEGQAQDAIRQGVTVQPLGELGFPPE